VSLVSFECEVSPMVSAVDQFHDQLSAGASPALFCLPDVDVLVSVDIVVETTTTGGHGLVDTFDKLYRVTRNIYRLRITRREDIQALVAAQAELHWYGAPSLG